MSAVIQLVPYRAQWAADYQRIRTALAPVIPADGVLHHIGSTAIPGMVAKDVIDLQLSVDRLDTLSVARIEQAGFTHRPGRSDHCPPGAALEDADLAKFYFTLSAPALNAPAAHLHVRERGRYNQRYALLFRDYLRADPAAAAAYQAVKQALVETGSRDPAAYYAVKDPVCDAIMAGAEPWARATAWREPAAD